MLTLAGSLGVKSLSESDVDTNNDHVTQLYADLLKQSLVNWHYGHTVTREMKPISLKRKAIAALVKRYGYRVVESAPLPKAQLTDGVGTYSNGSYTMVGLKRLNNVEECVRSVIRDGIPGDFLEAGVWRGGTCIFMRGLLKALGDRTRTVWVADSFAGIPEPDVDTYPQDADEYLHEVDELAVSLETVRSNFARFDLLDDRVRFLKGYFKDTLYTARIDRLAILRMDGDMYQSTWETLDALYPKLSPGGFLIVDDYARKNCAKAVEDYRSQHGITEDLITVDWTGAYWRKAG